MLGPVNAYQVQQQNVQNSQVKNPNSQPFLAQEKNQSRSERLNETQRSNSPIAQPNNSAKSGDKNFTSITRNDALSLISQGVTERGSLLDVTA